MKFVSLFDVNNYVKSVVGVVPVLFVRIRKKFRIQQDLIGNMDIAKKNPPVLNSKAQRAYFVNS